MQQSLEAQIVVVYAGILGHSGMLILELQANRIIRPFRFVFAIPNIFTWIDLVIRVACSVGTIDPSMCYRNSFA